MIMRDSVTYHHRRDRAHVSLQVVDSKRSDVRAVEGARLERDPRTPRCSLVGVTDDGAIVERHPPVKGVFLRREHAIMTGRLAPIPLIDIFGILDA